MGQLFAFAVSLIICACTTQNTNTTKARRVDRATRRNFMGRAIKAARLSIRQ
jgi:hypothetical protein